MKRPWFPLQPIDEGFFDSAPNRYVDSMEIAQPADRVWDQLTSDDPLNWCRVISDITWTSPRPFAVGTTRTARVLGGVLVIHERFLIWEEGRRKAFGVEEASLPLFRRFGEDYLVEPTSETSCRFTWTIAAEPHTAARPGAPMNAALARSLFRDTRRHFGAR